MREVKLQILYSLLTFLHQAKKAAIALIHINSKKFNLKKVVQSSQSKLYALLYFKNFVQPLSK